MYNFFAFLNRMKYIERWSLMRSVKKENIMEHSQQVSVIAHALAVIGNTYFGKNYDANKIGMVACFHETSEVITGDLPTPIKYFNPEIKTAYKDLEKIATVRLLDMLPTEMKSVYDELILTPTEEEHAIMKYADKLSAYIKCIEELKMGNGEFKKAGDTIKAELEKSPSMEVKFFLDNFIDGFNLTLDEIDK
ncbi:MAG: 5'-deoxynucleotidase [Clostridia bacterium]